MTDIAWIFPVAAGAFIAFTSYLTKKVFELDKSVDVLRTELEALREKNNEDAATKRRIDEKLDRILDEL